MTDAPRTATEITAAERKNEHDAAVFQLSAIINASIKRITEDPEVVIPSLMRNLAINVVTEAVPFNWQDTRRETLNLFRDVLDEAHALLLKAQGANDR